MPASCAHFRESMLDAASGLLSDRRRIEFDLHIAACAACRLELHCLQNVLQAIDRRMSASIAEEPSPLVIANIRRQVTAQTHRDPRAQLWSPWLAAAGPVAAVLILFIVIFSFNGIKKPVARHTSDPAFASSARNYPTAPRQGQAPSAASSALPHTRPTELERRQSVFAPARRESQRRLGDRFAEPQILVEPGQMQAVMQFVSEVQSGRINGEEIAQSIRASERPIEIKPLMIAPLKTAQELGATERQADGNSENPPGGQPN